MGALDPRALEGLYEAAAAPGSWPDALHRFALAAGSAGCRFRPAQLEAGLVLDLASRGIHGFVEDYAAGDWHLADTRLVRGLPLIEAGSQVILEHEVASDDERRRLPFYQSLLGRHDLPWWAGVIFSVDGGQWCLSVLRKQAQGPFTPAEAHDLSAIVPHLRNVVSLAARLSHIQARGAVEALERVSRAALVLDSRGTCLLANALAENLLGGDLSIVRGRLQASGRESDRRLQILLAHALSPRRDGAVAPEPAFVSRRRGRPFMVEAFPATTPMRDVFSRIAALVVISDLDARPRAKDSLVRGAFGLTAAEARLAERLATGEELRAASEALGVTYDTGRAHLRAIFGKAQVGRQSELVALLGKMAK